MSASDTSAPVVINARFLGQDLTGVQRYGREIMSRFIGPHEAVRPEGATSAIAGHWWEQTTLPGLCLGRLLWSPGNTGPLAVTRQVVTIHDASTLDHPEWFSKKFALWYRFLLPRLAKRVQRVITVSEFSRTRLAETCGIAPERITVIPNGVDARFHPAGEDELKRFRAEKKLERPYFLFFGSLEPRKNVAALLQAWWSADLGQADLLLAGASGAVFRDRGFGEVPPRTRLWGRVEDEEARLLMCGATGLVLPSLYEGFGLPVLEAMRCGCPVLISNTTSLPEVGGLAFDAKTGAGSALYFNPVYPDEIAARLSEMLYLAPASREILVRNGIARAAEYTWDRSAATTWRVLQEEGTRT